ncbi:MAG: VWA domain-containing protein [Oleispira sp.]
MELFFSQLHLLRPLWLLMLIPALVLFVLLLKRRLASARWHGIIDESLMPHVLDQMPSEQSRWPLWFILFAWVVTSIALSGPAWEQLLQPVQKKEDALVIVLDMSLSMAAQDVIPDRATRARQKVIDILQQRNEGLTALVVYAGDAYTVTPLTDDADTIINLVPALTPFIMPAMGSRPDKALALADKLILDAGLTSAKFLLITDGIQAKDIARIEEVLGNKKQQLSVLTLGSEEGAPIAMQEGGFKRDSQGNIVLPKLDLSIIKRLASVLNIRWHQMSFDDTDWHYLLSVNGFDNNALKNSANTLPDQQGSAEQKTLERQFDLWADQGYWLIFIIIIIAAFSFRRGWLLSLAFLITLQPETSYASAWDNVWQTKDQQAQQSFEQDPAKAAELFEDPDWKASSFYRAEDYQQAAENFSADESSSDEQQAESHFNRGNALAHAGELEKAIEAYEQSLALDNDLTDAEFNKSLVEQLLQQQEEQQQDDPQESDEKQDSDQEKSDDSESKEDQSEQQDSDKDSSDEQESDQQSESDKQSDEEKDADESESQAEKDKKSEEEREKEAEQKEQAEQSDEKDQSAEEKAAQQAQAGDELSREEKQALEQWLNRIPDDPGGLLKRKFLYQYKQRDHQDEGEVSW